MPATAEKVGKFHRICFLASDTAVPMACLNQHSHVGATFIYHRNARIARVHLLGETQHKV